MSKNNGTAVVAVENVTALPVQPELDITALVSGNLPELETEAPATGPTLNTYTALPADVRTAIMADRPDTTVQTLQYTASKGGAVTVIMALGVAESWTPAAAPFGQHVVGAAAGKRNEYDDILADLLAVRGGAVFALPFGFKADKMGFRRPDYSKIVGGLEKASFRILDRHASNRIDRAIRVVANDVNADDASTVAGYVLIRATGYRVK
jgi:hypothetical protein